MLPDLSSFSGVSIDTRSISPGNLFIALKGKNHNGHNHIEEAFEKGASFVIRDDQKDAQKCINVPCSKTALGELASRYRSTLKAHVIGITGSAGKTSTKEIFHHALSKFGKTFSASKSHNNDIGVPLTILNCKPDIEFLVLEIGTNHRGEIASLTKIAKPDTAFVTSVGLAHLEGLFDLETIKKEKSDICAYAPLNAFLPQELLYIPSSAKNLYAVSCLETTQDGDITFVKGRIGEKIYTYATSLAPHLAQNTLNIVGFCDLVLGLGMDQVFEILKTLQPYNGRGQWIKSQIGEHNVYIMDESYNANPLSMKAAIESFHLLAKDHRKIAVIGDMLELGSRSQELHLDINLSKMDKVFCCGKFMFEKYQILPNEQKGYWAKEAKDLIEPLSLAIQNNDAIFFKSSNGSNIKDVALHFLNSTHSKNIKS
jgi:UDP-N-acetylmuramoyl-tripeptide--D-alanyl-D-alanine ligase